MKTAKAERDHIRQHIADNAPNYAIGTVYTKPEVVQRLLDDADKAEQLRQGIGRIADEMNDLSSERAGCFVDDLKGLLIE